MRRKRPCCLCGKWFQPHARVGVRQKVCSSPECQRERHRRNCASWRSRNPDYDRETRLRARVRPDAKAPSVRPAVDPVAEIDCEGTGYGIASGMANGIALRTANLIAPGTAKVIAIAALLACTSVQSVVVVSGVAALPIAPSARVEETARRGGSDGGEEGFDAPVAGAGAAAPVGDGSAGSGAPAGDEPEHRAGVSRGAAERVAARRRGVRAACAGGAQGGRACGSSEAGATASAALLDRGLAVQDRGVAARQEDGSQGDPSPASGTSRQLVRGHLRAGQAHVPGDQARARGGSERGRDRGEHGARGGGPGGLWLHRPSLRPGVEDAAPGLLLRDGARIQPTHGGEDRVRPEAEDVASAARRVLRGARRSAACSCRTT